MKKKEFDSLPRLEILGETQRCIFTRGVRRNPDRSRNARSGRSNNKAAAAAAAEKKIPVRNSNPV